MLTGLGIPLPVFIGYVVTFVELIGGILLIVGLLSRLAALLLTINLIVAILLVKVNIGLLSPPGGSGVGAELDLALIAGFLVVLLADPGRLSVDHALGYEGTWCRSRQPEGGGRGSCRTGRGTNARPGGQDPIGGSAPWCIYDFCGEGSSIGSF
jgi:hypothetical protein